MSTETKPDVKVPLATFNERLMAGLIDYGIFYGLIIGGIILQIVIGYVPVVGGWLSWILGWLFYILGIVAGIYIFFWMPYKKDGQSFGKKRQNIKIMMIDDPDKWTVRPVEDGDMAPMLIRAVVGGFEATVVPVVIAWYFITNDKNRQRLADQIAKTVVVQCEPGTSDVAKKPRE